MSLLTIVQAASRKLGLTVPTAVATSNDAGVLQLMELANEEGQELAAKYQWTALQLATSFVTVAAQNQGLVSTIAPNLRYVLNQTIWNRTLRYRVLGPASPQTWEQLEAMSIAGPWNQWRIQGGYIKLFPVPVAGQSCYFEYVTSNWALANDGVTGKSAFSVDTDTSLLNENIMALGLTWRWRAAKGLDFTADFAKYENQVLDAMGRDGSKPTLSMGGARYDILPGVFVSSGSWGV